MGCHSPTGWAEPWAAPQAWGAVGSWGWPCQPTRGGRTRFLAPRMMATPVKPPDPGPQGDHGEGCGGGWDGKSGGTQQDPAGHGVTQWDQTGRGVPRRALAALPLRRAGQAQYQGPAPEPPPKPLSQRSGPLSRLCDGKSPPLLNHSPDTPIVSFPGRFETPPPLPEVRNVAGFYWD